MFQLPNKPKLTDERVVLIAEALHKKYTVALQLENTRAKIISEINNLLQAENKDDTWISNIESLLEKAPKKVAPGLMFCIRDLPEGIREKFARLALEKAPKEVAPRLMCCIRDLPEGIREEIARLALEKAPKEAAPGLMRNLKHLPEGFQLEIARLALEKAPKEAAPEIMSNLIYLNKEIGLDIVRLLVEKDPQKALHEFIDNLRDVPEGVQLDIAFLLVGEDPQETHSRMTNRRIMPGEIQLKIACLLLEKAPKEAAPEIMNNLKDFPRGIREEIARLALEKAPKEAAPGLMRNLIYLPPEIQEEIKSQVVEILETLETTERITERNYLKNSENRNPILYKGIEDMEEPFFKKEFIKDGTRTVLLGGTFINNVIIRIIPNHAFISWLKAYSAVEVWTKAEFDYVPIEPILRASVCQDGENTRVYAGVLGVSVENYLEMYSNSKHHENVKQQVQAIIKTLETMGIDHGHIYNNGNFCVLHNRTPEGEIDWDAPPRVYCIDFDRAVSS